MGYVVGGLLAGLCADALGYSGAIALVAAVTASSGVWVAIDFPRPDRVRHRQSVAPVAEIGRRQI
jgi:hypothetical protein